MNLVVGCALENNILFCLKMSALAPEIFNNDWSLLINEIRQYKKGKDIILFQKPLLHRRLQVVQSNFKMS